MAPQPIIVENTLVRRKPEILYNQVDGEVVMLHFDRGEYYGFNPVASFIWENIGEPTMVSQLIVKLLAEFEVDQITCERQTIEFLQALAEKELIMFPAR